MMLIRRGFVIIIFVVQPELCQIQTQRVPYSVCVGHALGCPIGRGQFDCPHAK